MSAIRFSFPPFRLCFGAWSIFVGLVCGLLLFVAASAARCSEPEYFAVQLASAATRAVTAELALSAGAGVVLAVTEAEAARFRAAGRPDVRVLGHAMVPKPVGNGPQGREGMLFVGALDDDDSPNADSLVWFVQEVMPRIDALIGAIHGAIGVSGFDRCRPVAFTDRQRTLLSKLQTVSLKTEADAIIAELLEGPLSV